LITLQNLNVVRIVATERERDSLLSQGYILINEEVIVEPVVIPLAEVKQPDPVIIAEAPVESKAAPIKKSKGKSVK
jgi:hypothetical protein